MLPYIIVAAGLGLLLTMVMYMRLAKRQETVQRGLYDATTANEGAVEAVRKQAEEAQTTVRETAEQFQSSLAAQEPLVQDVRTRIEGAESRFATFEERIAAAASLAEQTAARGKTAEHDTAKTLATLQDDAKSLGAAVQALRNTSDERMAEFAARIEKVERTVGLGRAGKPANAARPAKAKAPKPAPRPEPEPPAEPKPAPASSVISAMAAPSVLAGRKAAKRAAKKEAAAQAATRPTAQFDEEEQDEIDEGSARWIFVVLGLMLALAIIANVASR